MGESTEAAVKEIHFRYVDLASGLRPYDGKFCIDPLRHPRQLRFVIEFFSAVGGTVQYVEADVQSRPLVGALKLVRLIDRHLWILIAMEQQ